MSATTEKTWGIYLEHSSQLAAVTAGGENSRIFEEVAGTARNQPASANLQG
jgi:hypothetical protein